MGTIQIMQQNAVVAAIGIFVLGATAGAGAAAPTMSPAEAARLATKKAEQVTLQLMERGNTGVNLGTVTLQRIGGTRSRIRVQLANPATTSTQLRLVPGSDCEDPRIADQPHVQLLNPFTGRISETIVSVPITQLRSQPFLLHVRDATARQQTIDACANLNAGVP
jgi:hypothetical protein